MKYFDPDGGNALQAAFEDLVLDWPRVRIKTMFGCPSYLADATLFAVLVTEGVVLTRLPSDTREELETSFDTSPFKTGKRTVRKWIQVALDDPSDLVSLRPYVRASYESARQDQMQSDLFDRRQKGGTSSLTGGQGFSILFLSDLRGFGPSAPSEDGYMDAQARAVKRLLDRLSVEECALVTHDSRGPVGW